jgi:hypothetical protein
MHQTYSTAYTPPHTYHSPIPKLSQLHPSKAKRRLHSNADMASLSLSTRIRPWVHIIAVRRAPALNPFPAILLLLEFGTFLPLLLASGLAARLTAAVGAEEVEHVVVVVAG